MSLSSKHMPSSTSATVLDRPTVEALVRTVGHPSITTVAGAWLQAYDQARALGCEDGAARCQAAEAWDRSRAELLSGAQ